MEIEENTAARVQDASFLQKDAVVDEKLHNAIDTTATNDENLEIIKKSEADCSSAMNSSTLDKINEEKDDLLEQIEEVCNDKTSDLKNSTEISKTSEHEFLKEIEEMEKKDLQHTSMLEEKANNEELKAKKILECEASTLDAVVVGDKILIVKEDEVSRNGSESTSATVKELLAVSTQKTEEKCGSTTDVEIVNKDATVSSSTSKIQTNDKNLSEKSVSKPPDEPVQSTGTHNLVDEEKKAPAIVEDLVNEKMEVDNDTPKNSANDETDVDMKNPSPDSDVELVSTNLDNEAKSKTTIAEKGEKIENNDVEMVTLEEEKSSQSLVNDLKFVDNKVDAEVVEKSPEVVPVNRNFAEKISEKPVVETTKSENKPLLEVKLKENIVSSSLTNTPVSSSMVFNSTPIQKQFEISSENVSKITDAAELSHNEKEEATSTKPLTQAFEYCTTESGTCPNSETEQPSSDGTIKKYINAIKKYNGMPDTTTDEEDTSTPAKIRTINEDFDLKIGHLSGTDVKKDSTYEVNVYCEKNDVRYLSIERLDFSNNRNKSQAEKASASENSVQSSSNGSVTSLPAYTLPQTVETTTSASTSISTNCHSLTGSRNTHTILGIEQLCNFMINQFTKIKHAINPETIKVETIESAETPNQQIKRNKKNSPSGETPTASASKTKRVRKRSLHEDDFEVTPKSKQAKRETLKKDDTVDSGDSKVGPCVLAKWVDKKFYAGKITAEKPGNKYVVLFEDGASKTLSKDAIVFGEGDILPLQDQQVYALVEEDYERGIVLSIEKTSDKVVYSVKTDNATVNVTASDIYLEVDQAKEIQKIQNIKMGNSTEEEESVGSRPSRNKRPPASPSTPEAGYSGATGKRGGKRQKRLPFYTAPTKRLSESSNSSDTLESTPPDSPKEIAGLELVEGVQPELQNSQNDSELSRMIFISDYKKSQPNCDVDELLGPLPKSNTLFRNKHFLLTCTVGLRPHRYHQEKTDDIENNRFKQFSAVPYIKHYLQRQLEAGGARLYNYFEDVPKNKYKQCKLIAPKPCLTAKYVQCLSSDIQAISHDWVIDSCRQNKLLDFNKYQLPAGWSIISETFVQWKTKKTSGSGQPFAKTYVLIAGEHNDFIELWGRVCKAAGAKIRLIKSLDDITPTTTGYMVAESDISHAIKAKAQHYGIPVVSTVWVVQSIIMGAICSPSSHPKLSLLFEDDEI